MKSCAFPSILLILLVSIFQAASEENLNKTNTNIKGRIHRGYKCKSKNYPFMVVIMLEYEYYYFWTDYEVHCGGTLLRESWVLTAAHCNVRRGSDYVIIPVAQRDKYIYSWKWYSHPQYDDDYLLHDIALIRLKKPLRRKDGIGFVQLPKSIGADPPCSEGLIMGWGEMKSGDNPSVKNMQCAKIPMISKQECKDIFLKHHKKRVGGNIVCALSSKGIDSCQGDSGGPILCDSVQVGIISWGIKCGKPQNPGVYTRLDTYLDFIEKTMSKGQKTSDVTENSSATNNVNFASIFLILLSLFSSAFLVFSH